MPINVGVELANGYRAGDIEIECIESTGRQPDSVNVYRATITNHPANYAWQRHDPWRRTVTVSHRYGDHWTVLLRKVLEAFEATTNERETR